MPEGQSSHRAARHYVRALGGHQSPPPSPRESTRMRLEGESVTIDLEDASPEPFYEYLARSKTPTGAALLDQSVVPGVGNVYRAEVLHLLKIHPSTPARALSPYVDAG